VTPRWAITGGSGFLGLHLVRRLIGEGRTVRSLDLEPQPLPEVEARIGDVRDRNAADWLVRGADVLVHAAAALPIRGSTRTLRSINVAGTQTVVDAAVAAGVRRAILVSSAVVYGLRPSPVGEDAEPAPIEAYGRSKLEAEQLWRSAPLETVILRPTAFVGPGRLGVFGLLFDWIREGRRIYTLGPGTNRYQLLAVEDLVEAVLLAVERPVAGDVFNLGATRFGTVAEELGELIRRGGSRSRIIRLPAAPARVVLAGLGLVRLSPLAPWHYRSADRDFSVDVSRTERKLGWTPQYSNAEALWRSYEWYVEHRPELGIAAGATHRAPWREKALGLARRLS
jgi:nucleoside-diphosphate-sugar epimerase